MNVSKQVNDRLVASGTATQANAKISAVDGTAFLDFGAANILTDYVGCRVVVKSKTNGTTLQGWIGKAGIGETYSQKLTNVDMELDASWSDKGSPTLNERSSVQKYGGSYSRHITTDSAGEGIIQNISMPTGALVYEYAWIYPVSGASYRLWIANTGGFGQLDATLSLSVWTKLSGYRTANEAPNTWNIESRDSASEFYTDNVSCSQVLTPSNTGVVIYSSKGGATQNWTNKSATFTYNDAAGYDYYIYKSETTKVVASGSVTQANTRLDTTDTGAFAWLNGVDLYPYQDGNHLLRVVDGAGVVAFGWISREVPVETLGGDLLSGWNFTSGWSATANCSINDANTFTTTSNGYGVTKNDAFATIGALYKTIISAEVNCVPYLGSVVDHRIALTANGTGYATRNSDYDTLIYLRNAISGETNVTALTTYRVTDPPHTGARILSSRKGSTRAWTYKGAGFNPNHASGCTYEVLYVGEQGVVTSPVLGAELFADPGFDNSGTWTQQAGWSVSGSSAYCNGTASADIYALAALTTGAIHRIGANATVVTSGTIQARIGGEAAGNASGQTVGSTGVFYSHFISSASSSIAGFLSSAGSAFNGNIDAATCKSVTLSSLLAPTRSFLGSGAFSTTWTSTNLPTGEWGGGLAYTNETYTQGLWHYLDRTTGKAELRAITGYNPATGAVTSTSLISAAVTFSSGTNLELFVDVPNMKASLFYNGAQVGASQDLSAYTWVATNSRHCLFSTRAIYPGSVTYSFENKSVQIRTGATMKLSTVAGGAFLTQVTGVTDWPTWLDSKMYISDGTKTLVGYPKALGTGETLGSELIPDPTFDNASAWTLQGGVVVSGGKLVWAASVGPALINPQFNVLTGLLYRSSTVVDSYTSGSMNFNLAGYKMGDLFGAASGTYIRYRTSSGEGSSNTGIGAYGTSLTATMTDASLKQVLTPDSTGVTVVSSKGGTTQSFTSDSGVNPNAASFSVTLVKDDVLETSTPVLGAELVLDGSFTSEPAGLGTNWTNYSSGTGSASIVGGALQLVRTDSSNNGKAYQMVTAVTGSICKISASFSSVGGTGQLRWGGALDGSIISSGFTTSDVFGYAITSAASNAFLVLGLINSTTTTWDNLSARPLTLSSLLAPTRPFTGSGRFYTTATTTNCGAGEWLGSACYLDSLTSPTKGLFAFLNRTTGKAELRVLTAANTWVSLIDTAVTFVSGAQLVPVVDLTEKKAWLFYNNAIVGTAQDLTSYISWLTKNQRHAIFSTTAVTPGSVTYDYGPVVLGSELVTAWSQSIPAWNTLTTSGSNIILAVDSDAGQQQYAVTNSMGLTSGALMRLGTNLTLNSGTRPSVYVGDGTPFNLAVTQLPEGFSAIYFVVSQTGTTKDKMYFFSGAATNVCNVACSTSIRRVQ